MPHRLLFFGGAIDRHRASIFIVLILTSSISIIGVLKDAIPALAVCTISARLSLESILEGGKVHGNTYTSLLDPFSIF